MRFAVVGDSESAVPFVKAIAADPRHQLLALAKGARLQERLGRQITGLALPDHWESLLADDRIEAIVVADGDDDSLQAAKQLAQAGKRLCLAPAAGRGATFAYELTLLQDEHPATLVPLLGLRGHPLAMRLKELLGQGRYGDIRHLQLERRLVPARPDRDPSILQADDVASAFLIDVDLARSVWGEFDQVTAIRSGDADAGFSLATVTLGGAAVPPFVWSVAAATTPSWRLTVVAERGTICLSGNPDDGRLLLEASGPGSTPVQEAVRFDVQGWLLESAGNDRLGAEPAGRPDQGGAPPARWEDFTRGVELLHAVDRSVRRRRTIEIHFETPSELGQFKTHMTAAGCSLLMLTLLATVAYLTTATLIDINHRLKQVLVFLIFAPLGLFLALQALVFVARPPAGREGQEDRED